MEQPMKEDVEIEEENGNEEPPSRGVVLPLNICQTI
jgi:hypothetical protein